MKNGKVFVDIVYCIFFSVLLTENFTELFHLSKKREREKSWDCIWMKNIQTCVNLNTIAEKNHIRNYGYWFIAGIYFYFQCLSYILQELFEKIVSVGWSKFYTNYILRKVLVWFEIIFLNTILKCLDTKINNVLEIVWYNKQK